MALHYEVRPISDRTPFRGVHVHSRFATSWRKVLLLLEREVGMLNGRKMVMEMDVAESQIRIDGHVRADARPSSPAVRIAFESKHGPLQYATDEFWDWQDNVYAIALSLEALRKVDRYGVSRRGEQYQGWKALPPGSMVIASSSMTVDGALEVIHDVLGWQPEETSDMDLSLMIRRAKSKAHPDRHDGDRTVWDRVELASQVLARAGMSS